MRRVAPQRRVGPIPRDWQHEQNRQTRISPSKVARGRDSPGTDPRVHASDEQEHDPRWLEPYLDDSDSPDERPAISDYNPALLARARMDALAEKALVAGSFAGPHGCRRRGFALALRVHQ